MLPRGFGLLLTTETDHAELGSHHGRRLRGRTERSVLRVALGQRSGLRLTLSHACPVAVEVIEGERRYELPIAVPADPWLRSARRLLVVWALSLVAQALLRRGPGSSHARSVETAHATN